MESVLATAAAAGHLNWPEAACVIVFMVCAAYVFVHGFLR